MTERQFITNEQGERVGVLLDFGGLRAAHTWCD